MQGEGSMSTMDVRRELARAGFTVTEWYIRTLLASGILAAELVGRAYVVDRGSFRELLARLQLGEEVAPHA